MAIFSYNNDDVQGCDVPGDVLDVEPLSGPPALMARYKRLSMETPALRDLLAYGENGGDEFSFSYGSNRRHLQSALNSTNTISADDIPCNQILDTISSLN